MVAVINVGRSLRNTLNYNEQKLKQNKAELIHSANYAKDTECLGFTDKIARLEWLTRLNERTRVNSVHISLNFAPSERLSKDKLRDIADSYMRQIGFGDQPYLVYQHYDAGHPHIHIVTTNIQKDGSRIRLHNIGRNQSEKARKEIEKEFKLVRAQDRQLRQAYELSPVNSLKVQYGKSETKRAITNVLDAILPIYRYASLPELNAVLRQYNVIADRGAENSRTYKSGGLVYRVLDESGQKVGAPVKASTIYSKPTLRSLERRFKQNLAAKQVHKEGLKSKIDMIFLRRPAVRLEDLINALKKEQVHVVLRENKDNIIYGITYVDRRTKCVFNGSDLGKEYSANGLQMRLLESKSPNQRIKNEQKVLGQAHSKEPAQGFQMGLWEILTSEEKGASLPYELRMDLRRKRKRKRLHQ